ncbi:helix-turn-helix domain-containing protein [Gloeothece verrucosa]|uniref:helix-turn-helix domain-containing protein n=1 Tax=Gloeothece verrucosa TaxID=2546359 RepID=UPI0002EC8760|nr:helix-turn-helix domain-containing protein [Gloeothece verrucosa]
MLKADINSQTESLSDQAISQALDLSISTLERVRKRFVEDGIEAALARKEQVNRKAPRFNGEQEAHLIAERL